MSKWNWLEAFRARLVKVIPDGPKRKPRGKLGARTKHKPRAKVYARKRS